MGRRNVVRPSAVAPGEYAEQVVRLDALDDRGQLLGSIELEQPWATTRAFRSRRLVLRGQVVPFGHRFRSLADVRRWFTLHGASAVRVVYQTWPSDQMVAARQASSAVQGVC